jgi:hypothetical protein
MQRVNSRASLAGLALLGALFAIMLIVLMVSSESHGTPSAQAIVPSNTPTPGVTPTPKPNGLGTQTGLVDWNVGPNLYRCIASTSEDSVTLQVKGALQCYPFVNTGIGGAEPPCDAVHTTGGGATPVVPGEGVCDGHAGPPPYNNLAPSKTVGNYTAAGAGTVTQLGCFADIGSTEGPNAVFRLIYTGADAFALAPAGTSFSTTVDFWLQQSNASCTAAQNGTAPGGAPASLPITVTKASPTRVYCSIVGNCPIQTSASGCTDMQRLNALKAGSTGKCGKDPWDPYAAEGASPDVSGSYDILGTVTRADICRGGLPAPACTGKPDLTIIGGVYYTCKADIQQPTGTNNLTAKVLCYIDAPNITVNREAAGGNACPPADPKFCGDGLPAAPPPGCSLGASCATLANQPPAGCPTLPCDTSQYAFADIEGKHTQLTGTLDTTANVMDLSGCFEDPEMNGPFGNVFALAKVNAHTGIGIANYYIGQNPGQPTCGTGAPTGSPIQVAINIVRQGPGGKTAGACIPNPGAVGYTGCRDSDGDGCPDKLELSDSQTAGGLRDPYNRWDFFNPEKVNTPHTQTVSDIIKVVQQFGKDQGNVNYTIDTDRTAVPGGNGWNLGPPDGKQSVADILAAVKQFGQNCNATV